MRLCALFELLFLSSIVLFGCGDERAPPLGDFDPDDVSDDPSKETGGAGRGGGSGIGVIEEGSGGRRPAGGSSSTAGSGPAADGGSGGAGDAGAGGDPPSEDCAGIWTGRFAAYSQDELEALRGYQRVEGDVYIGPSSTSGPTDVTSFAPFSCLEQVDGDFTVLESPALADLVGLDHLVQVGNFTLSTNSGLESLNGISELVVLDILHLRANERLASLGDAFASALQLFINDNPSLPQCEVEAVAADLGLLCECEGNLDGAACD